MKKRPIAIAVGAALLLGGAAFVFDLLWDAGALRTLEPYGPKPLRKVSGFAGGTEDIVVRPGGNSVFISSVSLTDPSIGALYLMDVKSGDFREAHQDLDFAFRPHGMDLHVGADGAQRLFVVNHGEGAVFTPVFGAAEEHHTIEIFDVEGDGTLRHAQTVSSPQLVSPNEVCAVSETSFYASNDHGWGPGLPRVLENYLRLPLANLVYCEKSDCREVYSGASYANGMALSPDRGELWVAETVGRVVHRFRRSENGDLTKVSETFVPFGLDNLTVAEDGTAWIAGHANLLAFPRYARDPDNRISPTEIVYLQPTDDGFEIVPFFLDDGSTISAGSVAVPIGDEVLVGAVHQSIVLVLPRR